MSQKKRVVTETTTQKQQLKNNLNTYIERYREIELYLTLLTKPLVSAVIPTSPVGLNTLHDKVEAEIKNFLEQKLQILTGLAQPASETNLSSVEVSALKMIASKVLGKEPIVTPTVVLKEEVKELERPVETNQEPEEDEVETNSVMETESVVVEQIEESPVTKRAKRKNKTVVLPTEIPVVEKGVPTDTMKRSRPVGVKPLAPPTPEQEAHFAAQNEHMHEQLLAAQMAQAQTVLPDNLGMPNLANPMFR